MQSILHAGGRRSLLLTSSLLSLSLALPVGAALSLAPTPAAAQSADPLPTIVVRPSASRSRLRGERAAAPDVVRPAPAAPIAELDVPATTTTISGDMAVSRSLGTSDSAALIADIPGGAAWGAGGVSSLPAINGLGADRVQVAINSMLISPACPNEMNPPLSFVNPSMIAKMRAYLGVAPVSVGGDYIGAKIDVTTAPPQFAKGPGWLTSGSVSGFFRSNGNGYGVDASATLANNDTSITYTGGWARANDYKAGNGMTVKSTLYEIQNHALSISRQSFGNLFTVQVGGQFIPYQGYVNQYMDMTYNQSAFVNGRYEGVFDWGKFEAAAFYHHVRHTMGFLAPDKVGQMPMDTRATDLGYNLKATIDVTDRDLIRVGNEFHRYQLDDWWSPVAGSMMMSPNTFINVNDGRRTRLGTFVEWERHWDRDWSTLVGLRNDVVWSDTGDVQGYNAMDYGVDAARFNARDHARTDVNVDGSALLRYEPNAISQFEWGLARKTRSPNLYERYAWSTSAMAMNMVGWFGDGNGYVGNLDLKPEKAHTASFTAAWHDPAQTLWEVKVTPYYSYVEDYIDVDRCATGSACGAANRTATSGFVFLQFANHDAQLYGVNLDGKLALWDNPSYGRGVFRGQLSYVRGERTDGVNLYHVMPVNAKIALDHAIGNWTSSIELQLVGAKDEVSQVHNELTTPSYALLNLRTGYQWGMVRLDVGIDNLFNKFYYLPLGGADLVDYKEVSMMGSSAAYGYNVAGAGRSVNARLTAKF
ncbi:MULTISPECIES: TonB-dependent receptor [Rhodopseudomonas]|uniref:TonB-dependent receptor n=1 Tax=Rhodopseudomonas palustris TaxID=1076 RepID=A0A0D7EJC5_RHOPL|nr:MULTISPECIES: TonB-dependent receptor [Rhodopseudomonas]KIZ40635.1 TonB-dependent receptor [Rhodopseudomonas palustris]MDF3813572.1 TonB-dependent receptor plug domain-containing protein [Rhodopseudomonas sp. BAL398]WOK15642.1 TonB-dependent receptor plug domain-containing protein [Rhodopseudomonas sp. BAL398]